MHDTFKIITEYMSTHYHDKYAYNCPELSEARDDIILLQEKVFNSGISEEQHDMINELLKLHSEVNDEVMDKVYTQGMKDCVVILKELGIL